MPQAYFPNFSLRFRSAFRMEALAVRQVLLASGYSGGGRQIETEFTSMSCSGGHKNYLDESEVSYTVEFEDNTDPNSILSDALENLENAEEINEAAENIQQVLGTDPESTEGSVTLNDLLAVNELADETLQQAISDELAPPPICGCMATNQAGNNFDINRGTGDNFTTVIVNAVVQPPNDHGSVIYNGHICQSCMSDNEFTFTYGGNDTVPAFVFTATTFNVPHCANQIVTITGQGITDNPALFGPNPVSYSLVLNGVMGSKSISILITGSNGTTFFATTTQVGNGELVVTNCP
ncbi:hypothetical protein [Neobacillus citreus]|uniref:Uncharacterized protein n=1 Tax=Neobacillus citreus TaxID=2833578 RepID=A0A942T3C1_9BACI|nr:hypothetical protein [Neobacillus citreus]MCH6269164.1 hypothetical protein [Neobacillus citreus]